MAHTAITVLNSTLFHVAAKYLGDATQWIRIAQINAISDPFIQQLTQLKIPEVNRNRGGGIAVQ